MSINYTKIDQNDVRDELVSLMQQTPSFKNASFSGTVLYDLTNTLSYVASLYGFYVNQIANEPFLDTAKQYKNINRIANTLKYNPIGKGSAKLPIASSLSKDYVLKNSEGFIEVPIYSQFPATNTTVNGDNFAFVNEKPLVIQVKQFGVHALNYTDVEYTGEIRSANALDMNKLMIKGQAKRPIQIVYNDVVYSYETTMYSEPHNSLPSFIAEVEYSLLVRQITVNNFVLVIKPKTSSVEDTEIARFKVNLDRSVTFTQNFSVNKIYVGRLGFNNLSNVIFQTIPLYGKPLSVGKLNLIVPRYASAFEVLSNGEVFSFSSKDEDVIITSSDIEDNYFSDNQDVYITLKINDITKKWYGASLKLKKVSELLTTDTILGYIPVNSQTVANGNLKVSSSYTSVGTSKSGVVTFNEGDIVKRVVFDKEFDFGLETENIPLNNIKNYAIFINVNDNVQTYYSEKLTSGFKINVETDRGFSGDVFWTATEYETPEVEEKLVDIKEKVSLFDSTAKYSIMLQPSFNTNVWVNDLASGGFKIFSKYSFVGNVDYLIIPNSNIDNISSPVLIGQKFVPKGESVIQIAYEREMANTEYTLFLTPNANVKVWWENKTTDGFTMMIEPDADFSGIVSWQLYTSALGGTVKFTGGNNTYGEPTINYIDLNETSYLDYLTQGLPKISIIQEDGLIKSTVNGLTLSYNTDLTINPGLSFQIDDSTISYNNLRVYVKTGDTWVEWTEIRNTNKPVTSSSTVFSVRINKDKKIGIKFGNNDYFGKSPVGSQIVIIGLQCVGAEGNISTGMLRSNLIPSLNFDTNTIVSSDVEVSFLETLKINKEQFFRGGFNRYLYDYLGNEITSETLSIIQLEAGMSGTEVENVEQIRKNATAFKNTQDRFVTSEDYKSVISSKFSDIVLNVEVFNYVEAKNAQLIEETNANYFFNTLFFMMVPYVGTRFTLLQKDIIKKYLDNTAKKLTGIDSVILEPTFIPIDVAISYNVKKNASLIEARNSINNGVYDFFLRTKRSLGETINADDIRNNISRDNITSLSIMIKTDKNNEFLPSDYNVSINPNDFKDKYDAVEKQKLNEQVKKELRTLIDKGLVQLTQPLFDVQNTSGDRNWIFNGDISLGRFEFPILGDLVIERKV